MYWLWRCIFAVCAAVQGPALAAQPAIVVTEAGDVTVTGLDASVLASLERKAPSEGLWRLLFPVFLGDRIPDDFEQRPPILGAYRIEPNGIRFTPRFPFLRGRSHSVQFDRAGLYALLGRDRPNEPRVLETTFTLAAVDRVPTTRITQVFPSTDTLPANLLKL